MSPELKQQSTESVGENAKDSQRLRSPYQHVYSNGFCLPRYFPTIEDRIRNLEVRPEDIWVCSVSKSGTTWIQEAGNNVDTEGAKKRPLEERVPFLEKSAFRSKQGPDLHFPEYFYDSVSFVEKYPPPRLIKSHLPVALLPEKLLLNKEAKIVYVSRNPRDTCISFYHHVRVMDEAGDFEQFCELFMKGKVLFLPYWEHVLPFWRMRDDANVLFITYEEMKKDLKNGILKIAEFLGRTLSEELVRELTEHLSFDNMKNSDVLNRESDPARISTVGGTFVRCGQWKDVMSQDMVKRFEEWEREHLKDTDYPLAYD